MHAKPITISMQEGADKIFLKNCPDDLSFDEHSGVTTFKALNFSYTPITQTKRCSPNPVCQTNFLFPWRFRTSGFHCSDMHKLSLFSFPKETTVSTK